MLYVMLEYQYVRLRELVAASASWMDIEWTVLF